jgi:hypothetical protein
MTDPTPGVTEPTVVREDEAPKSDNAPDTDGDTTVGTGTSIALGCIAATVLLIVIGLVFLGVVLLLS